MTDFFLSPATKSAQTQNSPIYLHRKQTRPTFFQLSTSITRSNHWIFCQPFLVVAKASDRFDKSFRSVLNLLLFIKWERVLGLTLRTCSLRILKPKYFQDSLVPLLNRSHYLNFRNVFLLFFVHRSNRTALGWQGLHSPNKAICRSMTPPSCTISSLQLIHDNTDCLCKRTFGPNLCREH